MIYIETPRTPRNPLSLKGWISDFSFVKHETSNNKKYSVLLFLKKIKKTITQTTM